MSYTYTQLLFFLVIYGFLGWLGEVLFQLATGRPIANRGFFNLPLCLEYGVIADILLVVLSPSGEQLTLSNLLLQCTLTLVIVSMVDFLSGFFTGHIWGRQIRPYREYNILGWKPLGAGITLLQATGILLAIKLLHPFLYLLVCLIPGFLHPVISFAILLLLLSDFFVTLLAVRHSSRFAAIRHLHQEHTQTNKKLQDKIISRISAFVWRRMKHAYPDMQHPRDLESGTRVFARGVCWDKLIWIFVITALAGDGIETIYCRLVGGTWMSRSSLIYGPFSIVWGFGGVLITIILQHLRHKEDRHVFLTGMLLGGVYEYSCSVITEYVFGTTFWDYSSMIFNIGGRTNLLFCMFWGIFAVFWVKVFYPFLSSRIEKIPPLVGKILTWLLVILFAADLLLSGAVLLRYVNRQQGDAPSNVLETFIDHSYSDDFVKKVWPNMNLITD